MKKTILLLALLIITVSFTYGFDIVNNGKSDCVIVVLKNANPAEKYAASEFQKYIKQSSGVELKITDTPQEKNNIFIATRDDVKTNWDTINLVVKNNSLYLKGDNDRGTIYSVYEFLEKRVGVRFFNDDRIIVPKKNHIFCSDTLNYRFKPSFMIRDTSDLSSTETAFGVCNRLNSNHTSTNPEFGGRIVFSGCHTLKYFLPISKYGETHPEYYALKGDSRYITQETQPCFSNPQMRKELIKNVLAQLEKSENKSIVDVSQNDNLTICECENCKKFIKEHGYSGLLIDCINEIADEVKKKYPNTFVETLSYQTTRHAPIGIVPRDNVMIRLCGIECNYAEPIGLKDKNAPYKRIYCSSVNLSDVNVANKNFCEDLEQWSKITKNVFIWEYIINFENYFIPHPNLHVLKPNLEYYHKNNVLGVYGQSNYENYNSGFDELRTYIFTRLMWNLDLDEKQLIKEFCDGVYGAGSENVQKCIDILTDIFIRDHYYVSLYTYNMDWMSDSEIIESINLYKDALEKTKNDSYCNDRIRSLYMSLLLGWYMLPNDRFEFIKNACNLPWNTKGEFYKELISYEEARRNPSLKECFPFNIIQNAVDFKKVGPTPEICKNLKDEEWYSLNNLDINPLPRWGAYIKDDLNASGGKIVCLKNNEKWGAHVKLAGNIARDKMEGYKGYDVYAVCKAIGKKGNEGDAYRIGFYDYDKNERIFRVTKPLSEIGEDFTTVYFGRMNFNDSIDVRLYNVGCENNNFDCIGVDKVIFIKIRN